MPKPTLLQTLLHRPSQTYHYPPTKEYHSTKHDLVRLASANLTDGTNVAGPSSVTYGSLEPKSLSRSSSAVRSRKRSSRRRLALSSAGEGAGGPSCSYPVVVAVERAQSQLDPEAGNVKVRAYVSLITTAYSGRTTSMVLSRKCSVSLYSFGLMFSLPPIDYDLLFSQSSFASSRYQSLSAQSRHPSNCLLPSNNVRIRIAAPHPRPPLPPPMLL